MTKKKELTSFQVVKLLEDFHLHGNGICPKGSFGIVREPIVMEYDTHITVSLVSHGILRYGKILKRDLVPVTQEEAVDYLAAVFVVNPTDVVESMYTHQMNYAVISRMIDRKLTSFVADYTIWILRHFSQLRYEKNLGKTFLSEYLKLCGAELDRFQELQERDSE